MPERVASAVLAELLGTLAHPERIRAVEELRNGELDVNTLCERVGTAHAKMSQHLAKLRALRLVAVRRDGRHVYYHLTDPALATWLRDGLAIAHSEVANAEQVRFALDEARDAWTQE
ncbi:MAG: metalloregulator ArsR/SmtB family transcription factor [Myxococcota bacterium]